MAWLPFIQSIIPVVAPLIVGLILYYHAYKQGQRSEELDNYARKDSQQQRINKAQEKVQKIEDKRYANIEAFRSSPIGKLISMWNKKHGDKQSEGDSSDPETK